MTRKGDDLWVPNPDGEDDLRATFVAPADPGDAIHIGGIKRDVAWVRYEEGDREGTLGKVPYSQIKSREE